MLPKHLIGQPATFVRNMAIGDAGFILLAHLQVDRDGFCYIKPDAELYPRQTDARGLWVTRDENGFNVEIRQHSVWRPIEGRSTWLSVSSIKENYEDDPAKLAMPRSLVPDAPPDPDYPPIPPDVPPEPDSPPKWDPGEPES